MSDFVIREPGRWWLAPVPGSEPLEADLAAVTAALAAVDATGTTPAPSTDERRGPGPEPLHTSTLVAPVWTWVGRLTPGGVALEGSDGALLRLDADDLRVLDALDGPTTVGELTASSGVADAPARVAALLAAGRIRPAAPAPTQPSAPAGTGPSTAEATRAPEAHGPLPPAHGRAGLGARLRSLLGRGRTPASPNGSGDRRIPVYALWQEAVGPVLSVGMLTAAARHWDGGALNEVFDIRAPMTAAELFDQLEESDEPAVLLCSNYVWSLEHNLDAARRAKQRRPNLVVVHGGPSTPKYPGDAQRFLDEHGDVADVLVRGEGEHTLCRVLEVVASAGGIDRDRLRTVGGLTFRDTGSGEVVRTDEPARIMDLDELPSPYLTGEYDHIDPGAWIYSLPIETNRGCPYGCTFCDWGSATLSRIRKFDLDRIFGELRWAADRQLLGVQICDANFGILARDVEVAEHLARLRRETRAPSVLSFTPAKNTTKHVTKILDAVVDAGFLISTAISLQTTDEGTLEAVRRSNISTEGYLALAAELRRRGLPLQGDLLIGLPGQTYESYKADLQFFIEHEIAPRSWSLRALPNAPMNDPDYRREHRITTDDRHIVTSNATLSPDDRERCLTLRKVQVIADQYGLLSHVMRFLQWDLGIPMADLLDRIVEVTTRTPARFPTLGWVFEYFDLHPTVAVGWHTFYGELRQLLAEELGIDVGRSDVDAVLQLQVALMPSPGRTFPAVVRLEHDYVSYYRSATRSLYTSGEASEPDRPLRDLGPADLVVEGDPLGLCSEGLSFQGDSRDEAMLGQFWIGIEGTYELLSPLTRVAPEFRDLEIAARALDDDDGGGAHDDPEDPEDHVEEVGVRLGRARAASSIRSDDRA